MKKILLISSSFGIGGILRSQTVLARLFTEQGHRVTIFCKFHNTPFFEVPDKVKIFFPRNRVIHRGGLTTFFSRLLVYKDFFFYLCKHRPDVVLSSSPTTSGSVIPLCRLLKIKVLACEHNNHKVHFRSLAVFLIRRFIYPMADMVTVLTERDKAGFYSQFMDNVAVIPHPVPFQPADPDIIDQKEKIILAIGPLSRWQIKGFDILLKAFASFEAEHPDWKMLLAGPGDVPEELTALIREEGLKEKIEFCGPVKDMRSLMLRCGVFALSSRREGFPFALLEAMSQGMACAAFDCFTGPREIITHGKNGLLVKDQDQEEMAQALSKLISDPGLRYALGESALLTSKSYLPDRILPLWTEVFEKLLPDR